MTEGGEGLKMLASSGVNPLNRFQFESLALLVREHEGGGRESEGGKGRRNTGAILGACQTCLKILENTDSLETYLRSWLEGK